MHDFKFSFGFTLEEISDIVSVYFFIKGKTLFVTLIIKDRSVPWMEYSIIILG